MMGEFRDYFRNKKNLTNLLLLGIVMLALPLGVGLVRQQQILRSRAVADPITFSGANVVQKDGKWYATKPHITVELTSPLGGVAGNSSTTNTTTTTTNTNTNTNTIPPRLILITLIIILLLPLPFPLPLLHTLLHQRNVWPLPMVKPQDFMPSILILLMEEEHFGNNKLTRQ